MGGEATAPVAPSSEEADRPIREPAKYRGAVDEVLRALAHPVRRDILLTLTEGREMSASELGRAMGLTESRLRDVAYQVRYLAKRGCITLTRVEPAQRGHTVVRFYRANSNYSALLAAIAELADLLKHEPPAQGSPPPVPVTRVPLRTSVEPCSCSNSLPDEDGSCINCTKPVAGGGERSAIEEKTADGVPT